MANVVPVMVSDPALQILDAGAGCRAEVGLIGSVADLRGVLSSVRARSERVVMLIQCSSALLEEYLQAPDPVPGGNMNHLVIAWVPEDDKEIEQNRLGALCSGRYATLVSVRRTPESALANCLSWLRNNDSFFVLWPRERGLAALSELITQSRATQKTLRATLRGG